MASHPLNLILRFLLEITALIIMGIWGWHQVDGSLQYVLAVGIPILASTFWGVFAVPQDPSRSGKAPIPIPGLLRLLLEVAFFGFAVWGLVRLEWMLFSWIFGGVLFLHYLLSYDRIQWLLSR